MANCFVLFSKFIGSPSHHQKGFAHNPVKGGCEPTRPSQRHTGQAREGRQRQRHTGQSRTPFDHGILASRCETWPRNPKGPTLANGSYTRPGGGGESQRFLHQARPHPSSKAVSHRNDLDDGKEESRVLSTLRESQTDSPPVHSYVLHA